MAPSSSPSSSFSSSNGSSLSLRTRKSMNDFEESVSGEWERDQAEEQHVGLLSKEDTENRRRSSFWDFEDDLEGDDDDHRAQRSQDKKVLSVWRYVIISASVGFAFLIFKILVLKLGHSTAVHHEHQAERLYNNGTHDFASTVILISLDGFRRDYLDRNVTPNLAHFAAGGMRAEYMNPSFPSITFPNHWTLVTGLYPESHGIVGNEFYDPTLGKMFIHKEPAISSQPEWWGGEPIWATCSRHGKRSGVIMWPGSHVGTHMPDYLVDYQRDITTQQKMDTALQWLDLPIQDRPQLIAIYIPQVDQKGHGGGPEGKQLDSVLSKQDEAIGYLMDQLRIRNLDSHVNIVIVSDHGMAQTDKSRLIYYEDILSDESKSFLREREAWPLLSLRPKDDAPPTAVQQIYEELLNYTQTVQDPHFQVYLRENIPERFHYRATERIAPVVAIPDVGYSIISHEDYDIKSGKDYRPRGIHGYDNLAPEMRAIFMAKGPKVQKRYPAGSVVAPFFNVEVYSFVSGLLNLYPSPNNGTMNGNFLMTH